MKAASVKAKGRKLQQVVRDKLLALFPHLTEDDVRSCSMGSNGEDILFSTSAREAFPWSVECKARAAIALVYDALDQAKSQIRPGQTIKPLAVIKADRKRPLAVIDLDDFLSLVAATGTKGGHE